MNELKLTLNEVKDIVEIVENESISSAKQMDERLIIIKISDNLAEFLSESIKNKLVTTGFDENYKLSKEGERWQVLLDKFIEIGW